MKIISSLLFFSFVCFKGFAEIAPANPDYLDLTRPINAINMVMVHDVVSPPVAARYYAYTLMGAYQLVSANNKSIPALNKFIRNGLSAFPTDGVTNNYYRIAAIYSIFEIAKNMLPSGYLLADDEKDYLQLLRQNHFSEDAIKQAVAVAEKVAVSVINFAQFDDYNKLSARLRYTPKKTEGSWYPTPPAYLDAVEPNWKTVKPLMLDSSMQFKPYIPVPFSRDSTSKFYQMVKEVRNVVQDATPEQRNIANFWDCNPFAITTSGHMAIGYKKISPGGHWMNVGAMAVKKLKLDFDKSVFTLQIEAIGLMDAFISCWDEKYRSDRIRPETYINRYIDINWKPLLQTPPFPEYTSGHAVVSHTAAYLLSFMLGNNFSYTDNTEIPFGAGSRSFKSFKQAASEASISRLYGGIHYRDSVEHGNEQGIAVANMIIQKLIKLGIKPAI